MHFEDCLRYMEAGYVVVSFIRKPSHLHEQGEVVEGWFPEGKRFLEVVNQPRMRGEVEQVHLKLLPPERVSSSLIDRTA